MPKKSRSRGQQVANSLRHSAQTKSSINWTDLKSDKLDRTTMLPAPRRHGGGNAKPSCELAEARTIRKHHDRINSKSETLLTKSPWTTAHVGTQPSTQLPWPSCGGYKTLFAPWEGVGWTKQMWLKIMKQNNENALWESKETCLNANLCSFRISVTVAVFQCVGLPVTATEEEGGAKLSMALGRERRISLP